MYVEGCSLFFAKTGRDNAVQCTIDLMGSEKKRLYLEAAGAANRAKCRCASDAQEVDRETETLRRLPATDLPDSDFNSA